MAKAKTGDKVKVHYTGKLEDGTVFDKSHEEEPFEFVIGQGQVIEGFEEAVSGMDEGESKIAHVKSDKGYGPHRDDMIMAVDRKQFPEDLHAEVGNLLQLTRQEDHESFIVLVTDISDDRVVLDANHPLAGKNLVFDIELLEISTG